ncbi:MAG TPA: PAS domain-containing protein [Vicinamibacterales bacterium]
MRGRVSSEPTLLLEELRNIYATAPVGLCCVDRELRYVSINDRLAAFNGHPASAHIGRTLREMIPQLAPLVEPMYRRVLETGHPQLDVELAGSTDAEPGVVRTWMCSYSPLRDETGRVIGVNTVVHDITDPRASAAALIESRAQHQAILSALPDLVFLISSDGTYLDVHPRDETRLFVPPEQFLGKTVGDVLPPEHAQEFARCVDRVLTRGSAQMDYSLPADGETRRYEARMVPCGPDRILAAVRDVTDCKRVQEEAERSRGELAHISRVTLLGEITASLAHELNQPLTAILANAQAARYRLGARRLSEAETDEILQEIVAASNRAGEVIRRVRGWLTRDQPVLQNLDVNQLVSDVERLLHSELIMRHVRLTLRLEPGLPAVSADRVQLQQVLLNLVLNGIEAMHDQPAGDRQLTITTSAADRFVRVAVRDRGTGIHPDHMDRLFDPFFSTKPSGLGVGLRICWSIVTALGGRVWAENNRDRGATFCFTLPTATDAG